MVLHFLAPQEGNMRASCSLPAQHSDQVTAGMRAAWAAPCRLSITRSRDCPAEVPSGRLLPESPFLALSFIHTLRGEWLAQPAELVLWLGAAISSCTWARHVETADPSASCMGPGCGTQGGLSYPACTFTRKSFG